MSIKAHNWFITDLSPFNAEQAIRETLEPIFRESFNTYTNSLLTILDDNPHAAWNDTPFRSTSASNKRANKRKILPPIEYDGQYFSKPDAIDVVAQLYGYLDALHKTEGKTSRADIFYDAYLMAGPGDTTVFHVYSKSNAYQKALEMQDWCRDFSYWDNADPDENISEEEWEQRKHYWDSNDPAAPLADASLSISQPSEILTIMCYINSRSLCRTAH